MRYLVLRKVELILLNEHIKPAQQQLQTLRYLLPHQFREPVKVILLLSTLSFVKVFIFIVRVFAALSTCQRIYGPLLQVSVQEASNQFDNDIFESTLATHIHCHALKKDPLPQVIQFARMEPY